MNKKILTLLTVCILVVSITGVCAAELTVNQDFDGLFKMKVAQNDNFTDISDTDQYSSLLSSKVAYMNNDSSVFIFIYDSAMEDSIFYLSQGNIDFQYQKNVNLVKTDGNLTIFNVNVTVYETSDDGFNINLTDFAGIANNSNDRTVIVASNNTDLVKEYASTISFN
ncbi:hypothetical protein SAMN05216439_1303 [Methanobrevibacter gottschalkii]|uniref:Uncharacterized protein n=1 Tax=Methanobrevibacter gottschalkii TaxID=190974 RepID=A0A1H7IZF9_9EURY|nr:hypothetical protein [Methanobrevibacter gottschalkii]SEK67756.1 hypothetical protein SAMN05216439_1303 [Methanobrevibacter gottschalkii]